ncbi:aminotransferase class I/II-fold pyridoxal phosphate-dependent enzyme [Streptomyces sp. TX20-6-3]|uniref:aminotransferase class I/II-fold pyridoxal phosphate-dependent enzyme n=1 Tax=Streptomyces sp. TX20-6-3 TaxID=3028705 RepID=UPI0034DEE0A0
MGNRGSDILGRNRSFYEWQQKRVRDKVWPFGQVLNVAASPTVRATRQSPGRAVNLSSQDYLSLSSHPDVIAAAHRAIDEHGIHSAGSACLSGNSETSLALEREIGEWLDFDHVLLFPTGWAASYAIITALIGPGDYVLMDALSHSSLQQGARAATRKVQRFNHLDNADLEERLQKIRNRDSDAGILVVTEGLFSMDSDKPQLGEMIEQCRTWGATLLPDSAHDFGSIGPRGQGVAGEQGVLQQLNLVMGSFSKSFSSNGGFLACRSPEVREYVKYYGSSHTFSAALSPIQSAVARAALSIVRSEEGDRRRSDLMRNASHLRVTLEGLGLPCIGETSAVVPVRIGADALARKTVSLLGDLGIKPNLVEYPAVPNGEARIRLQVMADHTLAQMEEAAHSIATCMKRAAS